MNLDTPTKRIEIVLGEAMTTTNCDITASYAVVGAGVFQLAEADLTTGGTTPVVVVGAPPSGRQNQVKEITFFNNDTVTHELTLRINNGGTMRIIARRSIPPDGDFRYVSDLGVAASASVPALLVESGSAAKISALPAFDLAAPPTGAEPLPAVESGVTVQITLNQLYTLFAEWLTFVATSPLDAAGGSGTAGKDILWLAGTGDGVGAGGLLDLEAGPGGANGAGGDVRLRSGNAGGGDNAGGAFAILAGVGRGTALGGTMSLTGGSALGSGDGGQLSLQGGQAAGAGVGGVMQVGGGNSTAGVGGDLVLAGGAGGAGSGNVRTPSLPTADPSVSTALWTSNARLVLSGAIITPVASTVTSGAAVALTTGTAKDVTTISVSAGNWTISGAVYFTGNAATTVTLVQGSVGTAANTLDTTPGQFDTEYLAGATLTVLGADPALLGFSADVTLGSTTTYRLDAKATFAINTLSAYGTIRAVPRA